MTVSSIAVERDTGEHKEPLDRPSEAGLAAIRLMAIQAARRDHAIAIANRDAARRERSSQ